MKISKTLRFALCALLSFSLMTSIVLSCQDDNEETCFSESEELFLKNHYPKFLTNEDVEVICKAMNRLSIKVEGSEVTIKPENSTTVGVSAMLRDYIKYTLTKYYASHPKYKYTRTRKKANGEFDEPKYAFIFTLNAILGLNREFGITSDELALEDELRFGGSYMNFYTVEDSKNALKKRFDMDTTKTSLPNNFELHEMKRDGLGCCVVQLRSGDFAIVSEHVEIGGIGSSKLKILGQNEEYVTNDIPDSEIIAVYYLNKQE